MCQPHRLQLFIQPGHVLDRDVAEDQVLVDRQAHRLIPDRPREPSERVKLRRGDVAVGKTHGHEHASDPSRAIDVRSGERAELPICKRR